MGISLLLDITPAARRLLPAARRPLPLPLPLVRLNLIVYRMAFFAKYILNVHCTVVYAAVAQDEAGLAPLLSPKMLNLLLSPKMKLALLLSPKMWFLLLLPKMKLTLLLLSPKM